MEIIRQLLNTSWFGSVLGLLGIVLAFVFYFRGRTTRRLVYQDRGVRLIGGEKAALPADVSVTFRGVEVPRLTKHTIVLWNAGNTSIRGSDIVPADPLRIVLEEGSQVLEARITHVKRAVNAIAAAASPQDRSTVLVSFDFLDPGDGARIELLHTAEDMIAVVAGTIRGLPAGCAFWGTLPAIYSRSRGRNTTPLRRSLDLMMFGRRPIMPIILVVIGAMGTVAGLFPDLVLSAFPRLGRTDPRPFLQAGRPNWLPVVLGLVYMSPAVMLLWSRRRRYPRALDADESRSATLPPAEIS